MDDTSETFTIATYLKEREAREKELEEVYNNKRHLGISYYLQGGCPLIRYQGHDIMFLLERLSSSQRILHHCVMLVYFYLSGSKAHRTGHETRYICTCARRILST